MKTFANSKIQWIAATLSLLVAAFILTLTGCQEESIITEEPELSDLLVGQSFVVDVETSFGGFYVPGGTEVTIVENGYDFIFPEEAQYYYLDINNEVRTTRFGGINCNCTQGSGCDPIYHDGEFACGAKVSCGNCKTQPRFVYLYEPNEKEEGGFIDTRFGIKAIAPNQQEVKTKLKPPVFWANTETFMQGYKSFVIENGVEEEEYKMVMLAIGLSIGDDPTGEKSSNFWSTKEHEVTYVRANIFGNSVLLIVPFELTSEQLTKNITTNSVSGFSCTCESGGSGCTLKKNWIAVWCKSSPCTSCTLAETK